MEETTETKLKVMTANRNHYKQKCLELERNQRKLYAELYRFSEMSVVEFVLFKFNRRREEG